MPQRNVYEERYKFTLDRIRYEIIMDFDFSILPPPPLWWRCKMWNISDSRRHKIGFTSESSYRFVSSFVERDILQFDYGFVVSQEKWSHVVVPTKRGSARSGRRHTHTWGFKSIFTSKKKTMMNFTDKRHVYTTPNLLRYSRKRSEKWEYFPISNFHSCFWGFRFDFDL